MPIAKIILDELAGQEFYEIIQEVVFALLKMTHCYGQGIVGHTRSN
jgi:hypothetical protein